MKRIGWTTDDGPLKTPESDRTLSLDLLLKKLLLEHRENQKEQFRNLKKKWSENEYVLEIAMEIHIHLIFFQKILLIS